MRTVSCLLGLLCSFSVLGQGQIQFVASGGREVQLGTFSLFENFLGMDRISGVVLHEGLAVSPVLNFDWRVSNSFIVTPSSVSIPGVGAGEATTLQIRIWETAFGSYDAAFAGGGATAASAPFTLTLSDSVNAVSPVLVNVPEPGAMIFAVGVLLFSFIRFRAAS